MITRTAEVLVRLSREQGVKNEENTIDIFLDLSRQELASLVGTTRETVTRTLSTLKKDKVIDFDGHKITILNEEQLEQLTV